jgi:ATP-dependent DNA helicase RecG
MMTMDERTRRNLEKIFETIEKRKGTFGKALVGFAFSRDSKDELKVSFGLVNFLGKGEASFKEETYDYGDFILTKRLVEVQDAINLLQSIFENQVLKLAGWPEIPLKVHLTETRFIPSRSSYGYISCEWPMLYAYSSIGDDIRGNIPSDSMSKLGLPLFPSGVEAINVFFVLRLPKDWYSLESRIELLVPDYSARIKNLRLAGNRVTIDVETKEVTPADVLTKFYCKGENKSYASDDLRLEGGQASFVADEEPFQVEAHIVSALDGEAIDKKRFDYRYPSREEGIIKENIEAQLLDMIDKGENVNVEFKKELGNEEFLETVVAFANTSGGIIFLGVDDNCRIKGFKEDVKAKIVDLIADRCDPSIEVQIDSGVLVQGTPITLVKVPESTNKPYTLKDRGIFVRRGSSDRQIKRSELDDIYAKKQPVSLYR